MKFCIVKRKNTNQVLTTSTYNSCYSEVTHGIETSFDWSSVDYAVNNNGASERIVIYESIEKAMHDIDRICGQTYCSKDELEFVLLEDVYTAIENTLLNSEEEWFVHLQ